MGAIDLVILDLQSDRSCSRSCSSIERLSREALAPRPVSITNHRRLPEGSGAGEPDAVVLRAPSHRSLIEALRAVRLAWRSTSVLVALCSGGVPDRGELLAAFQHGLDDFLCCPFNEVDFATRLCRVVPEQRAPNVDRSALLGDLQLEALVGESESFLRAIARVPRVGRSDATVLIAGETGVGKGLFARAIHNNGRRKFEPFIAVNCGALPDHLFENELFGHARGAYTDASTSEKGLLAEAEGGTVFLDEVDALSPPSQSKLLRFLQDHEYRPLGSSKTLLADVRVIAATNSDLREMVAARTFRHDLYHRLNVLSLSVPSLRERKTDIPLLASHFVARYAAHYARAPIRLSPAALRKMLSYPWPGNVRELESVLHRAVVFCSSQMLVGADIELPMGGAASGPERASLRSAKDSARGEVERAYVTSLLLEHRGNVSSAARASGIDRRTFQRLLRKYGIARSSFEDVS